MHGGTDRALLRPSREWLLAGGWAAAAAIAWLAVDAALTRPLGHDAHAYWLATLDPSTYGRVPGEPDAFLYSPAAAQVLQLVTWLPWPAFVVLWTAAAVASYLWLVRPLRWVWAVPLLALAVEDVTLGNVTWLLTVLVVLGMRSPLAWVPLAFTKVVAGVGLVWYAARRDWRAVGAAVGLGLLVLLVSVLSAPEMWSAYLSLMGRLGGPDITVRTVVAIGLVVWAARTHRPWCVPVALVVCAPLPLAYTWGYLLAVPRLLPPEVLERLDRPFGGFAVGARRALDLPEPRPGSVGDTMPVVDLIEPGGALPSGEPRSERAGD